MPKSLLDSKVTNAPTDRIKTAIKSTVKGTVKKRKARGSLSKGVIINAAKGLLHEQGIDALSIRKIANVLDAGPMSIYNHFATKQDIVFALVEDFVARAHQKKHAVIDWQEWLYVTFVDIFTALTNEPEYLMLMISSNNIGVASKNVFDDALVCLMEADFSSEHAAIAFHKLLSFTLGAAMMRANLNQAANESESVVHDVMIGSQFDTSLRDIIVGLK